MRSLLGLWREMAAHAGPGAARVKALEREEIRQDTRRPVPWFRMPYAGTVAYTARLDGPRQWTSCRRPTAPQTGCGRRHGGLV
jgi:hypothetical protein